MATVSIRGRGKGPISVSKSSLPFGNVALGTAVVMPVTLTSTSRSPFTLNSASTTGAGFSIVGGGLPMTLNPGQSTTLQVQFQPTAAGSVTGLMTLKTSSTSGSLPVVSLSGTGVNGAVAQPDPQLTVSPSSLSFGSLTVNTAATKTVTLTSSGSSALTVSAASISGSGFSIVSGSLPATLNPGQSTSLTVQFKPTTTGTLSGQLTISSDSTTGGTSVVALGGTGCGGNVSTTHVEHEQPRLWQRYGEYGDDQDGHADVLWHLRSYGERGFDHGRGIQHHFWKPAGYFEPGTVNSADGTVQANHDWIAAAVS